MKKFFEQFYKKWFSRKNPIYQYFVFLTFRYMGWKHSRFELSMQKKYPILYQDLYGNPKQTCLAFGLEIQPGWYKLVAQASKELNEVLYELIRDDRALCVHCGKTHTEHDIILDHTYKPSYPHITQIKEKFGQLCIYMSQYNTRIEKIIDRYEILSIKTCQICGKPGMLRRNGWVSTLCDRCYYKSHIS